MPNAARGANLYDVVTHHAEATPKAPSAATVPATAAARAGAQSELERFVLARRGSDVWNRLRPWYEGLSGSDDLRLIQRNIDRECSRNDIEAEPWLDFLLEVSNARGNANACDAIDSTLKNPARVRSYSLQGRELPRLAEGRQLYRFMRLAQILKYTLKEAPIPEEHNLDTLASAIGRGEITGAHLDGTVFGQEDRPCWCTLSSPPAFRETADRVRDRLGLKHIDTGHLLEIAYPRELLDEAGAKLRAPTALDSWAGGASNWIFAKRRGSGGPDWGYSVDMNGGQGCTRGSTEAVHGAFRVPRGQGHRIGLRVHGPLSASSPSINYADLLRNPGV
jgi:hypothetical protein